MITSNYTNIQNYFLSEEVKNLQAQSFVSNEDYLKFKKENNFIKTNNNILVRFGFFLLGNFVISSCFGVFGLFFAFLDKIEIFSILFVLAAMLAIVVAEIISRQNFFAYGFDDSFILSISLGFAAGVGLYYEAVVPVLIALIISNAFCAIRYVHVPSTVFFLLSLTGYAGYMVIEENIISPFSLPILLFFIASGLYFLHFLLSKNVSLFLYQNVFLTIKIFSLSLAYIAMNYFVVRELSEILLSFTIQFGDDIPLSSIFYFSTFAIPLFYIIFGLKQRDRIFFWLGLITLGLGISSVRYYYYILPIDFALILGGLALFALVFFAIKKTQDKTVGITFNEDKSLNPMAFDVIKTILINANVNATVSTNADGSPMEFGGGEYSGGGSGGNF